MTVDPLVRQDLAPSGRLHAAINLGNPVLAQATPDGASGITVDIAGEVARRLDVPLEVVTFDGAGKAFRALASGEVGLGFLANDPTRAEEVAFTPAYVQIEGVYAVPVASALTRAEDVDRDGVRVGVKEASVYDLHLTRELRHATLVRGREGVDVFVEQGLDVGAGIRQPVERFVEKNPGHRVLEPAFMQISQAVGVARSASPETESFLSDLVDELLTSGFVAESLQRSGQSPSLAARAAGGESGQDSTER